MNVEPLSSGTDHMPNGALGKPEPRTAASYERELTALRCTEARLRAVHAQDERLLIQKDELIQRQAVLSKESDHRMLNGLQMIMSMLSMQSRTTQNAETASQLAAAANRVAMIERVHRQLHCWDSAQTVEFKHFLDELCRDLSSMMPPKEGRDQFIVVEGAEISLPSATGIPLGFIASELITNAAKHGNGQITVELKPDPAKGYALSVSNEGSVLPDGFDPENEKGLGMKIIASFVKQIDGELLFDEGDNKRETRFTVLFENPAEHCLRADPSVDSTCVDGSVTVRPRNSVELTEKIARAPHSREA